MEWIQVFVIIGVFAGFFIYMMHKLDGLRSEFKSDIKDIETKIETKIDSLDKKIEAKFDSIQKEQSHILAKISNIEGQITQMRPNILPFPKEKEEDVKEN